MLCFLKNTVVRKWYYFVTSYCDPGIGWVKLLDIAFPFVRLTKPNAVVSRQEVSTPLTHEDDQSNTFFFLVQGYVESHASYMNNGTGSSEGAGFQTCVRTCCHLRRRWGGTPILVFSQVVILVYSLQTVDLAM
jgi:hypothetical protein